MKMLLKIALILALAAPFAALAEDGGILPDSIPAPAVSMASRAAAQGSTIRVTAEFALPKGMKVYKESLAFEFVKKDGVEFSGLEFPPAVADESTGEKIEVLKGNFKVSALLRVAGQPGTKAAIEGFFKYQGCVEQVCFLPQNVKFNYEVEITEPEKGAAAEQPQAASGEQDISLAELLGKLALAFLAGLTIGFSPCGYPMIPITAAIIGAQKDRGLARSLAASLAYILGLAAVYSFIGVNVARAGASFRQYIDKPVVIVPIAVIFVIMGFALLKDMNLTLPSGLAAKLREKLAGRKSFLAVFLLGCISAVFAGPCAMPLLGATLTAVAKLHNAMLGFWIMFAVALGMGVPLVIAGTATGLLPKAGAWMLFIKRLMGFVLLWAAAYFLRGIIGPKLYNVVTAVLIVAAVVSLKMLDRPDANSKPGRRFMFGAGLLSVIGAAILAIIPFTQPQRENLFTNATIAEVDAAIAAGKPVMLDFYGENCTACKELDRDVFTNPRAHAAVKGIAAYKINDKEIQLLKRYNVLGFPTVVFIEPGGKVRTDLGIIGYRTLDEFIERVEKFKNGR